WSQAIESRHNKDLNIWNSKTTKINIPECILRYQEIDKAEMRSIYLNFLNAHLPDLTKAFERKKSSQGTKYLKSIVAESSDLKASEVDPLMIYEHFKLHQQFKDAKEGNNFKEA